MTTDVDRLYHLLPAVYRERDESEGHPLRALLQLITNQADLLEADVARLWNNAFIETCDRWAIPYVGDLVSNNLLHDTHRIVTPDTARALFGDLVGHDLRPPIAIRTRADVAKTVYYRRRKGTVPMLEELARDVTGWPAHAVEFFELLGWTQYARNHLRPNAGATADIRKFERVDRVNGAFDVFSHTVDVRQINPLTGWYNIRNVGFFVWRLGSYPLTDVRARRVQDPDAPWRYHFSPLGNPAPLFTRWRREGDESGLATELHVPGPIRRAFFHDDLDRYRELEPVRPDFTDLYGMFQPVPNVTLSTSPDASLFIFRNDVPIPPTANPSAEIELFQPQVICRRLDPWPAVPPTGPVIAVDVVRGRLAIGNGWPDATDSVDVFYHYGFSADLGGGPYERGRWLVRPDLASLRLQVQETGGPGTFPTLGAALQEWAAQNRPNAIITILDNRTYAEALAIELADDRWLAIEAANGSRPHIQVIGGELEIVGNHPGSELTLNGLLIEGAIHVTGDLRRLRLLHTTLVPGRGLDEEGSPLQPVEPSLIVEADSNGADVNLLLRVQVAFSILGPIRLPEHASGLWLLDSIVDGLDGVAISATDSSDQPGPPATLERVTVLGASHVKELEASEVIFVQPVDVRRRQSGCVRFSFVPHGSNTPRRYRCQPDLQIAAALDDAEKQAQENGTTLTDAEREAIRAEVRTWVVPSFTSAKYGEPAFAQLHLMCAPQIATGAEDGSEMGTFCHLKQSQRETNLRVRLEEYLPFGLEPGVIYVT